MTLTGPYYWDGTKFPVTTDLTDPVLIDQDDFEDCCCVCETCTGTQPSAVVTTDGAGSCDDSGTYTYTSFTDGTYTCRWQWNDGINVLIVIYCKSTKQFGAVASDYGVSDFPDANCESESPVFVLELITGVTCVNGIITGTFDIDGRAGCPGNTMTVTVG